VTAPFRILEDAASAMLNDVQLKQRHVTGCGARRGSRLLAFHDFTVGQFPDGADSDGLLSRLLG
jgi:hypothetical protein